MHESGLLTVEWNNRKLDQRSASVKTPHMIAALYSGFRNFVESDGYDPIRYECIAAGDAFGLVLSGATCDDFANLLVGRNAADAESLAGALSDVVADRRSAAPLRKITLEQLIEEAQKPDSGADRSIKWIHDDWDQWNREQRLLDVNSVIFNGGVSSWYGANLRQLTSPAVEAWLAEHG